MNTFSIEYNSQISQIELRKLIGFASEKIKNF